MPQFVDYDHDGIMDEWIFTSDDDQKLDVLPTLDLIAQHHEAYEMLKLAKNDEAPQIQYQIGYLIGMFDSVVELHG